MSETVIPEKCDDANVMRLWRECGLPEFFLGNGGTNVKLLEFANRAAESKLAAQSLELADQHATIVRMTKALQSLERVVTELYPGHIEPEPEHLDEYKAVWGAVMDARAALNPKETA